MQRASREIGFTGTIPASGITIVRFGLAGAFAATLMFIGCWIAAQLPYGPTDVLVNLFTYAPAATTEALFGGVLIAAVMGFVAAALFGIAFAAFSFIERL
jgi:hypothetical protein